MGLSKKYDLPVQLVSSSAHVDTAFVPTNLGSNDGYTTTANTTEDLHEEWDYVGLSLNEVIAQTEEKKWRVLRNIVFASTFILILALIITAIASAANHPKCRPQPKVNWFDNAVYYRIYVSMFRDSDSDCVGDIKGIESQLDYIKDLGVTAISLSPVYNGTSSISDVNVIDHKGIDDKYGNIADIKSLIAAAHKKGMYVLLDFVPNQTGKDHPWFQESSQTNSNDKRNFYVWQPGLAAPNNWVTVNGSSAWSLSDTRNEQYLHQLSPDLPDLNLYSRVVVGELNKVLQYWISLGVDGFNIRHSGYMMEDYDMRNDTELTSNKPNSYENMDHMNTFGLERNMLMLSEWNHIMEDNPGQNGRVLITGLDSWDRSITSYRNTYGTLKLPYLSYLAALNIDESCGGSCMKNFVQNNLINSTIGKNPTWLIGSDTMSRLPTRLGNNTNRKEALLMLSLLLPGSVILYYGDELDMTDNSNTDLGSLSMSQPWRTPMMWDNSSSTYGFSNSSCPQLPSIQDASDVQAATAKTGSTLNFLKKLLKLRKENTFKYSSSDDLRYGPDNPNIFAFTRGFDGLDCYFVAVNLGSESASGDFSSITGGEDTEAVVKLVTPSISSGFTEDETIDTTNLKLKQYQGVVLSWSCGLYFK
ncbi:alpha-glucosidase-like [Argonauta hians]